MSRWDRSNDGFDDEEESRLMKKFYDYAELEKKESERKRFLEVSDKKRSSVWGNRFVLSAIIQGAIITGLTVAMILMQIMISGVNLIEFLSLSLNGSAKWFFFGYFMYITLVVAIAITAIFYNHLESNLNKPIRGNAKYLVWAQLIGMNVGGASVTILLIIFGLIGTGFADFVSGEEPKMQGIMESIKMPITGFALIFACGTASGIIAYITSYLRPNGPKYSKISFNDDSLKYDRL